MICICALCAQSFNPLYFFHIISIHRQSWHDTEVAHIYLPLSLYIYMCVLLCVYIYMCYFCIMTDDERKNRNRTLQACCKQVLFFTYNLNSCKVAKIAKVAGAMTKTEAHLEPVTHLRWSSLWNVSTAERYSYYFCKTAPLFMFHWVLNTPLTTITGYPLSVTNFWKLLNLK